MPIPKRKKWTEAEERTLIDKYEEMVSGGIIAKMKTREKKFRPIALFVNSVHHARDPAVYPWQWTWKDVSTKVQNMRHQYLLVKQKIKKKPEVGDGMEEFDWVEGLTHWSNFLRYKEVFGDVELVFSGNESMAVVGLMDNNEMGEGFAGSGRGVEIAEFGHHMGCHDAANGDFVPGIDAGEHGVLGIGFEYEGEGDENYNNDGEERAREEEDGFVYEEADPDGSESRKRRKVLRGSVKKAWSFLANQLRQLREMEVRFEQHEVEREQERQRRECLQAEIEQEQQCKLEETEKQREEREKVREGLRRQWIQEWEAMDEESEQRERKRREEEFILKREWEERMNRKRIEWKNRINDMLAHHRAEMGQIQSRILHEQQNLTGQLLGIISQWTGHPSGLADHTGAGNQYLSQMMQNLHHVDGIVHGDPRVDGDNHDDHFIVDG